MLLQWLGFQQAHDAIDAAIDTLLEDPARRTRDLGGTLGTNAFTHALCEELERRRIDA